MRAALLTGYSQDFEIAEIPDPTMTGANDVIVEVGAAGFCRTDVHLWSGHFASVHEQAGISLPFVCGHESAGWIAEIGAGVTHLQVGDPVLLHPLATCGWCAACRSGDDMHCSNQVFPGVAAQGGFAQYVRTNARAVVPIPDGLTPVQVAPLGDAGLTAYRAVKKALPLAVPGTTTVVLGAGGLGHIAIQALRALSQTEIVVVDRNPTALAHAKAWGADHVVLSQHDRSHVTQVRELTGGAGAQVVLDFVGEGGAQHDAVELLGKHGLDVIVGYGGRLEADILSQVLTPEASFVGSTVGTYTELVELVALVRRGAVALTTTTFPLEDINVALNQLEQGQLVGRGILLPER